MNAKIASRAWMFAAAAGLAIVGAGGYVWHEQSRAPILEIYLFSLKGGQAAFIRTPDDRRILIDGGANSDIIRQVSKILPFYSRRIDSIIVTKADTTHASGLVDVVSRYSMNDAYVPAITLQSLGFASTTDAAYQALLDALEERKIAVHSVMAGETISLDSKVSANILFPVPSSSFPYSKASDPELLMNISYGTTSIALLGNASNKIQKFIASTSASSFKTDDSKALIFSHSATQGNISPQLVNVINPTFLVYSQTPPRGTVRLSKSATSKKKTPPDPLADVSDLNRFNLKEKGIIKITSDGKTIQITDRF